MSTCPASGNLGFPVMPASQIASATAPATQAMSFKLAASPTTVARRFDESTGFLNDNGIGGTTFTFGNTPYSLAAVQVAKPHNPNYITDMRAVPTGTVLADVVFYFEMLAGNYVGNKALAYIVPLVSVAATGVSGVQANTEIDAYLAEALEGAAQTPRVKSVEPFFYMQGRRVLYSTCLNMGLVGSAAAAAPTMTVQVIISPPAFLTAATAKSLGDVLASKAWGYMWPSNIPRTGGETPVLAAGQTTLKSNNRALELLNYTLTDSPVEPLGRGGRLEYVRDPADLRTTQQYKCMPLDEIKDVSGNMVLLDPASGTRTLADELGGRAEDLSADMGGALGPAPVSKSTKMSAISIFAIVLGVLLGVALIGGVLWWILRRSGGGDGISLAGLGSGLSAAIQFSRSDDDVDGGMGARGRSSVGTGAQNPINEAAAAAGAPTATATAASEDPTRMQRAAAAVRALPGQIAAKIVKGKAALKDKMPTIRGRAQVAPLAVVPAPAAPAPAAPAATPAPAPVTPAVAPAAALEQRPSGIAGTGLQLTPTEEAQRAAAAGVQRTNQQMTNNELGAAFRAIGVPSQPFTPPAPQVETRQATAVPA